MRITHHIIGFLAAAALFTSCQRENEVLEPVVLPAGGKGGKAVLNITPQHHKKNINDGKVYIKYAATTMPGMNEFDDSGTISFALGRPAVVFDELTQGDYYIYATGIDYDLEAGKDMVMGGAHFRVVDTLDKPDKPYDLYLQMDNHIHHD